MRIFRKFHISATGSALILANQGNVAAVNVNTGASSAVLTLYDGLDNTGNVAAVIDASSSCSKVYLVHFHTGIYYTLAGGNADITISYD